MNNTEITIEQAMNRLKQAMKEDDYAYGWHANIAMSVYDECTDDISHEDSHRIGNDAATRFMKTCFDAETSLDMLLDKKQTCGSCDKQFTPEDNNERPEGDFCDECLENKEGR
jgi:hypothetical protein